MARGAMTPTPSNGSMSGEDRAAGAPCSFTNCKLPSFSGTPLCLEHLQSIGVKPKKPGGANGPSGPNGSIRNRRPDMPASGPPSPSASKNGVQPRSPFLRRKTAPSVHKTFLPPASTIKSSQATSTPRLPIAVSLHKITDVTSAASAEPAGRQRDAASERRSVERRELLEARSMVFYPDSSSPMYMADFLPSDSASPQSSDGAGEILAGGRLAADGGSSNRGVAATNGITAENSKPRTTGGRGGLNDKENQNREATTVASRRAGSGPRGWWDVEYRRRGKTAGTAGMARTATERPEHGSLDDLSYARLPIPSTPLRISALYRRDRGTENSDRSEQHRRLRPTHVPLTGPRFSLDAYVYSQDGASEAPAGVPVPSEAEMATARTRAAAAALLAAPLAAPSPFSAQPSYIFAHMDPRIHWMRPRPAGWHTAKQAEIKARGGRKANFGKVARRMAEQRRRESRLSSGTAANGITNGMSANGMSANGLANGAANGIPDKIANGTADGLANGAVNAGHDADESADDSPGTGPNKAGAGSSASGESAWERDLPPEVHGNKQWIKFLGLFSQHSDERRESLRAQQQTLHQR